MSEKIYTDEELCRATQIAYCDIKEEYINKYREEYNGEYPTLQEIMTQYGSSIYSGYDDMGDVTGDQLLMKQGIEEFCDAVAQGEICQGWRVVSVADTNDETGFYGVTIGTDNNSAIVAFRGSESTDAVQFMPLYMRLLRNV